MPTMFPNPVWIGAMGMMSSTTSGTKEIALVVASAMLAGMPKTYQGSAQVIAPCTNTQTTPKEDACRTAMVNSANMLITLPTNV